jgi:hypothetical protein
MKVNRITIVAGLGALCLSAGIGFSKRVPMPPAYCDVCVMERDVCEYRLAGKWKVFERTTFRPTPVSDLLHAHKACPEHKHQWTVPIQVAEADLETSDAPRVRSIGFLNAPRSFSFLRSVWDYTTSRDIAAWRDVAWQPAFASALEPALRFNRYPENGFTSREEFLAWWQQNAYPLFNRLNEVTVAD